MNDWSVKVMVWSGVAVVAAIALVAFVIGRLT